MNAPVVKYRGSKLSKFYKWKRDLALVRRKPISETKVAAPALSPAWGFPADHMDRICMQLSLGLPVRAGDLPLKALLTYPQSLYTPPGSYGFRALASWATLVKLSPGTWIIRHRTK